MRKFLAPANAMLMSIFLTIGTSSASEDSADKYTTSPHSIGVWIVDKETGNAKFCRLEGTNGNYRIVCIEE